jgi:hypothetical protein
MAYVTLPQLRIAVSVKQIAQQHLNAALRTANRELDHAPQGGENHLTLIVMTRDRAERWSRIEMDGSTSPEFAKFAVFPGMTFKVAVASPRLAGSIESGRRQEKGFGYFRPSMWERRTNALFPIWLRWKDEMFPFR